MKENEDFASVMIENGAVRLIDRDRENEVAANEARNENWKCTYFA